MLPTGGRRSLGSKVYGCCDGDADFSGAGVVVAAEADLGGMDGAARMSAKRFRWTSNCTYSMVVKPRRRAHLYHLRLSWSWCSRRARARSLSLLMRPSFTSRCTTFGVSLPSLAHVSNQDSSVLAGIRTLNELLLRICVGLYFCCLSLLCHELDELYVEDGVVRVDARLGASKIDCIEDEVLLRLCGLCGVRARGRFKYASRRRAAFGRCSTKSSYNGSPQDCRVLAESNMD